MAQPSLIACSGQRVVQPQDVPPILVTEPKTGCIPSPGSNNSKIRTIVLIDNCCDHLNTPSQSELSTVGSLSYVDVAATKISLASETGSVYLDGKRRSARANFSYTADGTAAADEVVLDKAKRLAAARNLDCSGATNKEVDP